MTTGAECCQTGSSLEIQCPEIPDPQKESRCLAHTTLFGKEKKRKKDLGGVSHSYHLGLMRTDGKSKFSDAIQGPSLQADFSKDDVLGLLW